MKVVPLAISILAASLATASTILFITNRNQRLQSETRQQQLQAGVSSLESSLGEANKVISGQNARLAELSSQRDEQGRLLDERAKRIADLKSQNLQAHNQLGLKEETERILNQDVANRQKDILELREKLKELDVLHRRIALLEQEVAVQKTQIGPDGRPVQAVATQTPGSIVAIGPSNAFLVANLGNKNGATKGGHLLIRRGTDFIGSALISEVFDDLCIAQVDPHALREALHNGDGIVLSH